jgi:hypothetical protein
MRAAVLCNGPSRVNYKSRLGYDYVIGCNIPWTEVDANVIIDNHIVIRWAKNHDLIKAPTYFSEMAWRETCFKDRQFFMPYFLGLVYRHWDYDSSGHHAAVKAIELGHKQIDIYGCDSWWSMDTSSATHKYHDSRPQNTDKHVIGWRQRWNQIINNHQDVKITFIGEPK